jgi:ATP-dependent HslUV protease ATP-binding subunit HslU
VQKLISGPGVSICNECVAQCEAIIEDYDPYSTFDDTITDIPTPKEIKAILDEYVIGQDRAKKILSVAVHNHYRRINQSANDKNSDVEFQKSNILIVGPTGCGKTLLAETLAKILKVPFAIADATTLTEAGYVGDDVENIIHALLMNANEDIEKAQKGIVYIDEIDKIAGRSTAHGPDVSREGVQRDLLPLVEGSVVSTKYGPIRTDHILFIAAGAFHISKPSDLIPELQGRFPLRAELDPLTVEDFVRILTEPDNALTKQYAALLATEEVEVEFTPDGIEELARSAFQANEQGENIGARRLHTVMEKVLEDVLFEAGDAGPMRIIVNAGFVRQKLADVLKSEDLTRFIL